MNTMLSDVPKHPPAGPVSLCTLARGGLSGSRKIVGAIFLLVSLSATAVVAQDDESTSIIALTLPQTNTSGGYFPLSKALRSVMKLAVADINAGALSAASSSSPSPSPLEGNLTLSIVEVGTGSQTMEGLCDALSTVGKNGTFGIVGPMLSSQASLLETISNDFFGLSMVTPSASAARAATYFSSGASLYGGGERSFLFGVQPDVFDEMEALARLILDLKMERDMDRGWNHASERVSLIYPDDTYGTIAASAFVRAVRSTEGINVDSNAAGQMPSTIELMKSKPVDPAPGTDYRPTLRSLMEAHASIVVLLSEGFDGVFVRAILEQALEVGLMNEGVQWYLSGATATDGVFAVNDTYRDTQLAYDFRGAMGVRACPAIEGPGSAALSTLVSRWAALDADEYPGAGFGTLTPDGRLDPLLTYAYDAVFVLAAAIESVQTTAAEWGGFFEGFIAESCPFATEGLWEDGDYIREATLGADLVGVTGDITFRDGDSVVTSGAGTAGSGWRVTNGTAFCALNLQAHATLGATFATTMIWKPDMVDPVNGTATPFEKLSQFQKNQTFPWGSDVYPFDRPTLNRQHFEVITEEQAVPFTLVTGREESTEDYEGIVMDLLKVLSDRLGFTYNLTVANSSVSTSKVIDYVADGVFDMVASWVTITAPRQDIVSFSYPYIKTGLSFVYRPELLAKVSWWKMFEPFESSLWAAVILTTAIVVALLWLFDGAKNQLFTDGVPSATGSTRRIKSGMAMSSYLTGALLLGQMAHEPFTIESYILTTGWMFACFILAASFTAELASFLAAEKEQALSFGVDDLRNGAVPHSQVAVPEGTAMQVFYEEEIMGCFGDDECYGGDVVDSPVLCYTTEECFALVKNGTCKATLVESVTAAYRVGDEYCGLDILLETFNDQHYGLVLPKDSPYLDELETAMLNLYEDGTLSDITETYLNPTRCAYLEDYEDASATSQNLTLIDLGGVFLVLGMFVGVSFVLWVFRRSPMAKKRWSAYYRRQEEKKRKRVEAEPLMVEKELHPTVPGNFDDLDTGNNSWGLLRASSTSTAPKKDSLEQRRQEEERQGKHSQEDPAVDYLDPAVSERTPRRPSALSHTLGTIDGKRSGEFDSDEEKESEGSDSNDMMNRAAAHVQGTSHEKGTTAPRYDVGVGASPSVSLRDAASVGTHSSWVPCTGAAEEVLSTETVVDTGGLGDGKRLRRRSKTTGT